MFSIIYLQLKAPCFSIFSIASKVSTQLFAAVAGRLLGSPPNGNQSLRYSGAGRYLLFRAQDFGWNLLW